MVGGHAQLVAVGRQLAPGPEDEAGVVHQHIEARVAGVELGGGAAHLAQVGEVGEQHIHTAVAGDSDNFALSSGGLVGVACQQHHVGAHFSQFGGRYFPDAGSGAGDEDDLVL